MIFDVLGFSGRLSGRLRGAHRWLLVPRWFLVCALLLWLQGCAVSPPLPEVQSSSTAPGAYGGDRPTYAPGRNSSGSGHLAVTAHRPFNAKSSDLREGGIGSPSDTGLGELQHLLATALEEHPEVLAAGSEWQAARAETRRAGALMDPQLSLTQGLTDSGRQTLALEQRVPLFGQRGLAAERAQHQARAAQAQRRQAQAEVARNVLSSYAEYAYVHAAEKTIAQQSDLLDQMLEVTRTRYRTGGAGQGDLLRLENELDSLENQQTSFRAMLPVAGIRLNTALGRPSEAYLPPPALTLLPMAAKPDQLVTRLAQNNPQLQMLAHQRAAGHTARTLAQRTGLPDLMVGVEHMRGGDMGRDETNLMLGINLPIWRGRVRAERDQADARYQAVTERLIDRQQQLHADLTMALFSFEEALRNRDLYTDVLVPRAEQALNANLSAYRAGNLAFADLIASQREWLTFQLNQQRALADALQWQGELMFLLGPDAVVQAGEVEK